MNKIEKNVVRNEVKEFNKKTGLNLDTKVMERLVAGIHKNTKSAMNKRIVRYIGGNAVKNLRAGNIENVSMIGVEYQNMMNQIAEKTSLGQFHMNFETAGMDEECFSHFVDDVFGRKLMFRYHKNAVKLAHKLSSDGVSSVEEITEIAKNKAMSNTLNYLYDTANHQDSRFNSYELAKDIEAIAPTYMAVREVYNQKNFFGKWFTREGWFLRNTMNSIKNTLVKANESLGNRSSISTEDITNLLHREAMDSTEAVETGLKDAFLNIKDLRARVEIEDTMEEEVEAFAHTAPEEFALEDDLEYEFA